MKAITISIAIALLTVGCAALLSTEDSSDAGSTADSPGPEADGTGGEDVTEIPEPEEDAGPPTPADPVWTTASSPVESELTDVWGDTGDDLWMVGLGGVILRVQDGEIAAEVTGVQVDFYAVWGSGTQHVWVAGADGSILAFDGEAWASQASGTDVSLQGLCGSSDDDVWAVGQDTTSRWDGNAWTAVAGGTQGVDVNDLWMTPDAVSFATGEKEDGAAALLRRQGDEWMPVEFEFEAGESLEAVWGKTSDDFWAVGTSAEGQGLLLHFDGEAWSRKFDPPTPLHGVWQAETGPVWVAGDDGLMMVMPAAGEVTDVPLGGRVNAVYGFAADDAWAVGVGGAIHHLASPDP